MSTSLTVQEFIKRIPILRKKPFFSTLNPDLMLDNVTPACIAWDLSEVTDFGSLVMFDVSKFVGYLRFFNENPSLVTFRRNDVLIAFEQLCSNVDYHIHMFFLLLYNPFDFITRVHEDLVRQVYSKFPLYVRVAFTYIAFEAYSSADDYFVPYYELFTNVTDKVFFAYFVYPIVTMVSGGAITPFGLRMIQSGFLTEFVDWCCLHQDELIWNGGNIDDHFFVVLSQYSRYDELQLLSNNIDCLHFVHDNHSIFHYITRLDGYPITQLVQDTLIGDFGAFLAEGTNEQKHQANYYLTCLLLDMIFQERSGCVLDILSFLGNNHFDVPMIEMSSLFDHPFGAIYMPHVLVCFGTPEVFSIAMHYYKWIDIDWHPLFEYALSRCLVYKADYIARNCRVFLEDIHPDLIGMVLNRRYASDTYKSTLMDQNRCLLIFILYHRKKYFDLPYLVGDTMIGLEHKLSTNFSVFASVSYMVANGYLRVVNEQTNSGRFFSIFLMLPFDVQENMGKILMGRSYFQTQHNINLGIKEIRSRSESYGYDNDRKYCLDVRPFFYRIRVYSKRSQNGAGPSPKTFTTIPLVDSAEIIQAKARADSHLVNFETTIDGITKWPDYQSFVGFNGEVKIKYSYDALFGRNACTGYINRKRPYAPIDPTIVSHIRIGNHPIAQGCWFRNNYYPSSTDFTNYTVNDTQDVWSNSYKI